MSSAFMVENILTTDIDKDVADHHHHHHNHHHHHQSCESMTSSSSDTESDVMSDIKDSLCGSPRHDPMPATAVRLPLPDKDKLQLSESLLRTYAMIRQSGGQIAGLGEMCCGKCGHFQAAGVEDGDGAEAKCAKCGGGCEMLAKDATTILGDAERTTSIVGAGVTKPILKFSVSAILGDRKECVKVRNGKNIVRVSRQATGLKPKPFPSLAPSRALFQRPHTNFQKHINLWKYCVNNLCTCCEVYKAAFKRY